ncbi:unnamed protein product [Peniophora sp. CBMAI 1063]|nr:unnamed protein product [Peniophora sp. CBMAI 1063]
MAGSKDRILNKAQVAAVGAILRDEFGPIVATLDPQFTGYAAVSLWASVRQTRLFEENPVFYATARFGRSQSPVGRAVDRKFRNYYRRLRSAHANALAENQD